MLYIWIRYIHLCYSRKNFTECLEAIEDQLERCNGLAEYPLFIKGTVHLLYILYLIRPLCIVIYTSIYALIPASFFAL